MEELEEVQTEEANDVEWQEGEVLEKSLVGQLEEELGEEGRRGEKGRNKARVKEGGGWRRRQERN